MVAAIFDNLGVESVTFAVAAFICVGGAAGVVLARNPVHSALSLVATLFGVAVLFIAQEAYFLAAIQVIVYAGAIVVLFLFVIMLLGVDRMESFVAERKPLGLVVGVGLGAALAGLAALPLALDGSRVTGDKAVGGPLSGNELNRLGKSIFTDWAFAFELTSVLLIIAVVGAVVLSRRVDGEPIDLDEFPLPPVADDTWLDDAEWQDADADTVDADTDDTDTDTDTDTADADAMADATADVGVEP